MNTSSEITKHRVIALVGNPNSGKTTLFNALTHLRQKVGNYPGVTVEKKTGTLSLGDDQSVEIIDLPGTYSLSVRSPDEQVARDVLFGKEKGVSAPDLVICVVDAGNLERNLYLVTQVQDLGLPMIVVLNMMDEVKRMGRVIDIPKLSDHLGVPLVEAIASQNVGIEAIKNLIKSTVKVKYQRRWQMSPQMESLAKELADILHRQELLSLHVSFAEALNLISQSKLDIKRFLHPETHLAVSNILAKVAAEGVTARTAVIEARYDWIKFVLNLVVFQPDKKGSNITENLDRVLTHKFFGWFFFIGLMGLMFYTIFTVASIPMDFINNVFNEIGDWVKTQLPQGDLNDLIVNGVIAGVGGVLVFMPQILILFFFIGLLQDTGYMARAAFIMDRVMSKVGLHGKSFIPLLSSFACAIPGIMSARTIENPKDRLVTILVAPLMSCSARLPVYAIMIVVLMPQASSFQKAGVMLMLYVLGIVGACSMAFVFKKTLLRSVKPVFLMELPPYRFPSWKSITLQMWERSRLFLQRAGTIILALSIILWALMAYPKQEGLNGAEALKASYAGQAGTFIEPIIKPLGYDWRIGIGLVASFAAREVFVSTMSIVFNIETDGREDSLKEAFEKATWPDGKVLFTPLVCVSLMIFYVFALQCLSTIAVVYRETNSWQWPLFQFIYMSLLAYFSALLVFQFGRFLFSG